MQFRRCRSLVLPTALSVAVLATFAGVTEEPAAAAPSVDTAPAITPTAVEQRGTLTVGDGVWTTVGSVAYTYAWFVCEDPDCTTENVIAGESSDTLTVPFTAAAKHIRAKVTATDDEGSTTAESNTVGPVRLALEAPNENNVVLGDLASRSQRKQISVGGTSGNYTVIGTDSLTDELYSFLTDVDYASGAQQRESDERPTSGTYSSNDNASTGGRSGVLSLTSNLNCPGTPVDGTSGNTKDGFQTFCSVFGPEVWTLPFDADSSQALAFDYAAAASDNYEVYAYLVEVSCSDPADHTSCDYGGAGSAAALDTHSIILHRRGKNSDWTTATGVVPDTGRYRFRFVDGSYDATGGLALGTTFYIDPTSILVGAAQTITFAQPGDAIRPAGSSPDPTLALTISNSSPLAITTSSLTTDECTISGTTVTLKANGTCTIRADAAGGTDSGTTYVAASTVIRSFTIRAAATAPQNSGRPVITGTTQTGATLTAQDGSWGDGGDAVTDTTYQWSSTVSGVTSAIAGATAKTLSVPCSLAGATITVAVTKTNGVGSTSADSNATAALTEGDCNAAPAPPDDPEETPVAMAVEQAAAIEGATSVLIRGSAPVPVTTTVSSDVGPRGGLIIEDADRALGVTVTTSAGVSKTAGVIVPTGGEVICEICAQLAAGSVVEAWVYSTPRLAAAVRVEVDAEEGACPLLRIPTGTPLDGGDAIEPGAHTLQLRMYTDDGFEVLAFPITVGGPVPTNVPSGEGPTAPHGLLGVVAVLGLLGVAIGLRQRVATAVEAR